MKIDLNKIKGHIPKIIGQENSFKAAVCITLIENNNDYDVLFEVRSDDIADQPGDVCFPGGEVDTDEAYEEACLREVCEELLISPEQIEIICASDFIHDANTTIYPFVGVLKNYNNTFCRDEVAKIFSVPLKYFLETEPARYIINTKVIPEDGFPYHLINGGKDYKWRSRQTEELFYEYDGYVIWGLTARILHAFCSLIMNWNKLS